MVINCPLFVMVGKKRISLNLNVYRNLHHQINNKAKVVFKTEVLRQLASLPFMGPVEITYTLFPRTRRLVDISNVCTVVDKFFSDALVSTGKIEDDNYNHIKRVSYQFGYVDNKAPRVEAHIKECES